LRCSSRPLRKSLFRWRHGENETANLIRAQAFGLWHTGTGTVERAAHRDAYNVGWFDAKTHDAAGKAVHHYEYPETS
jgi:hypothetical protein